MNPNAINCRHASVEIRHLVEDVATTDALTEVQMGLLVEGLMARMPLPKLVVRDGLAISGGRTLTAVRAYMHGMFALSGTILPTVAGMRWADMTNGLQSRIRAGAMDVTYVDGDDVEVAGEVIMAYLLALG